MPETGERDAAPIGWTPTQRRALLVLLCVFLLGLGFEYVRNRAYVADPQPARGARYDELMSQLDPNTADWRSLAAIPGLGEKRAKAIVAYREHKRQADPDATVFKSAADLRHVRGIGPAMVENLRPYLTFSPAEHASTPP